VGFWFALDLEATVVLDEPAKDLPARDFALGAPRREEQTLLDRRCEQPARVRDTATSATIGFMSKQPMRGTGRHGRMTPVTARE
jgi:hypothetical protein